MIDTNYVTVIINYQMAQGVIINVIRKSMFNYVIVYTSMYYVQLYNVHYLTVYKAIQVENIIIGTILSAKNEDPV